MDSVLVPKIPYISILRGQTIGQPEKILIDNFDRSG